MDERESVDDAKRLPGGIEPPPYGRMTPSIGFTDAIPFGSPPDEPVKLIGDIPWELREE